MLQRKCPKCENGIMSDLHTFQGWGRDGSYVCDSCGHLKNIYEGSTVVPYIILILFEVFLFIISTRILFYEYIIYGIVLVFLVYKTYMSVLSERAIKANYPLLGKAKDDFKANNIQTLMIGNELKKIEKRYKIIKIAIAFFLITAYSIMLYTEESTLGFSDYVFYLFLIIVLPLWLVFSKFEK